MTTTRRRRPPPHFDDDDDDDDDERKRKVASASASGHRGEVMDMGAKTQEQKKKNKKKLVIMIINLQVSIKIQDNEALFVRFDDAHDTRWYSSVYVRRFNVKIGQKLIFSSHLLS